MYEVATREISERSLLCLKRNVDEQGQWAFGKEFIAILRERPLPKIEGRAGAFFCIQWGWEAFVALPAGPGGVQAVHFQLAIESLQAWGQEQEREHEREPLALTPEDLGLRMTYLATGPVTETSVPDDYCDLALPFSVER
jgi:hypothetical protein